MKNVSVKKGGYLVLAYLVLILPIQAQTQSQTHYNTSSVLLVVSQVADIASSYRQPELNPLYRGKDGVFDPRKAILIKGSVAVGTILLERYIIHKKPRWLKPIIYFNASLSGVTFSVAVTNTLYRSR